MPDITIVKPVPVVLRDRVTILLREVIPGLNVLQDITDQQQPILRLPVMDSVQRVTIVL